MQVEIQTVYLISIFFSVLVFSLIWIRPFFSWLIWRRLWLAQDHDITWSISRRTWIQDIVASRLEKRIILLLVSGVFTIWLLWRHAHPSFLTLGLSLNLFFIYLCIELLVPPNYALTKHGIITCTPDFVTMLTHGFRVQSFFISWKRVKNVGRNPQGVTMFIASGRGIPDPIMHTHVFPHRKICVYAPKKLREEIFAAIVGRTQVARRVLK